ncbi:hypothetical protein ACQP1P_16495 [Dactylosporangium sp. CA-052675]|uniref:hypothetical protein n=1 Tax=Dactylosporangium sp. CA-052675 TaxID=3239927 RepID=UPI003D9352B6
MNPPAPARRGLSPAAVVAIVLAAVLLVGGGIAGAAYLTKDEPGGNGPAAAGSTGAGAATGAAKAGSGPGRYNLDNVPEDECRASDASMFDDLFEAELSKPTPSRNPNATINSSTCGYTRVHALTDAKQQRTASISFTVFAANDVSLAQNMQNQETSTARLAGPNSAVPDLGEEAVFYETPGTGDQVSRLTMTLGVRDSNVRLQVYFIGSRGDGAAWTQREKNDVRDRIISAAKATFTKSVAGMKR